MKGVTIKQQQPFIEENQSNLTCASGETCVSSAGSRAENCSIYPQNQYCAPPLNQTPPPKKKRNLPGNPGSFHRSVLRIYVNYLFYYSPEFMYVFIIWV